MKLKSAEWVLLTAVCVLVMAVMFGHVTAVKNIALGLAVIGLLAVSVTVQGRRGGAAAKAKDQDKDQDKDKAAKDTDSLWPPAGVMVPMLLWLGWGALSMAWSLNPEASFASWLDEIVYPFVGFLAFYRIAVIGKPRPAKPTALKSSARQQVEEAQADRPRYAVFVETSCWVATLLLAALSLYGLGALQPASPHLGLLHFYERVGHTSTFAIIVLPLFVAMSGRAATRLAGLSGIVLSLVIGCASLNRFYFASAVLTLAVGMWPVIRRHRVLSGFLALILIIGGTAAVLCSTAERTQALAVAAGTAPRLTSAQILEHSLNVDQWQHALDNMASNDTRPMIWRYYAEQVQLHPWLGVGFGKPLPGLAYRAAMPQALVKAEPAVETHAHDMFLNTLLQVGVIGLALECLLLLSWVRAFLKAAPGDIWLRSAGVALVAGVVSKNLTDDFLWQSTMLAFWAHAGWLMGRARLSAHLLHRATSGRSVAMRRLRRVGN